MPALSGGMMLYNRRSAKSVACSRLNVIGVSAFFFLPVFVAAFTRADEFHSVTNTRWPLALSHFASSPNCVVLPDPSIPSTTNSFPGYSCGFVRLLSISVSADLDVQRLSQQLLEWGHVPCGRPELELCVAAGPDLQQGVVAAIVQLDPRQALRVAAVEAFRQPENRRQLFHDSAPLSREVTIALMVALRGGATMISRDQRHRVDFVRLEAAEIAVRDEVVRMLVVAFVADVRA